MGGSRHSATYVWTSDRQSFIDQHLLGRLLLHVDIEHLITERAPNFRLVLFEVLIQHPVVEKDLQFSVVLRRDDLTDFTGRDRVVEHALERGTVDAKVPIVDHELKVLAETLARGRTFAISPDGCTQTPVDRYMIPFCRKRTCTWPAGASTRARTRPDKCHTGSAWILGRQSIACQGVRKG